MTSHVRTARYLEMLLEPYPEHRHRFTVKPGSKHDKLMLDGRMLLVLTRGRHDAAQRTLRNAEATLRRALSQQR